MTRSLLLCSLPAALLTACAAAPPAPPPGPPSWVMAPFSERGFAATDCIKSSGNLSMERQMTTARARADIAKQIEVRVAAMDKTYARLAEENGAQSSTSTFESVSKQLAEQTLSSSQVVRAEFVKIKEVENFCAMVEVGAEKAKQLHTTIVQAAVQNGAQANLASNEVLYREFVGIK